MFNNLPSMYWDIKTKIEYLQRRIIVASIQYYELNDSCIPDNQYDSISQELLGMKNKHPKEFKKTRYYYCFKEFDGSTGFDIPRKLNKKDKVYLTEIATMVLKSYHKQGG